MANGDRIAKRSGRIRVLRSPNDPTRGMLGAGTALAPCALGRTGIRRWKREGDGATPSGHFHLIEVLYRADRLPRPLTRLPATAIRPDMGWCDDPGDRAYNRPVRLPYPASHERLWRQDGLYDLMVVVDYNLARPVTDRGSAIFLHIAGPDFAPTAGCVAIAPNPMRRLLAQAGPETVIEIG